MHFRLNELATLAADLGLDAHRVEENRLNVRVADAVLAFCNLADEGSLVGFDGTPWHYHDVAQFETGAGTYIDCSERDILIGLAAGELVIVSQLVAGELRDRWIGYIKEPLDLTYMRRGEELRIQRLPEAQGANHDGR